MAKRRNIWPDLLTDRRRRKTSMNAMCLYYDLLMCCDDQGIFPYDLDKIILEVIPYFRGSDDEAEELINELHENKFIESYTPLGHEESFLVVCDWHQQGALSDEYNKYPNKDGVVSEGRKRLGGKQRYTVIKSLVDSHSNICPSCDKEIYPEEGQQSSDIFTIREKINPKSRGCKYAENYELICKNCAKTKPVTKSETGVKQCVTKCETSVTRTGIRDKGLGLRDKGLGLRDKENIKQEVASAPDSVEYKFLSKISKKYHEDIVTIINHWSETMGVRIDLNKGAQVHRERALKIVAMLSDGYTLQDCLNAVTGCLSSPHHMGKNDRGTKYNEIHNIFNHKNGMFAKFVRLGTGEETSTGNGYAKVTVEDLDKYGSKARRAKYDYSSYIDAVPENRLANKQ